MDLNLLPQELSAKNRNKARRKVFALAFVIVAMGAFYLGLWVRDAHIRGEIVSVDEQIGEMEEISHLNRELDKKSGQVRIVEEISMEMDQTHVNFYDLFHQIRRLLPKGVSFTELSAQEGVLDIKGLARTEEEVAEFVDNLYGIEEAHSIEVGSKKIEGQIEFTITFSYARNEGEPVEPE